MSASFGVPSYLKHPEQVDELALFHDNWAVPSIALPSFEAAIPGGSLTPLGDRANAKVPIPRNAQRTNWINRGRVSRACENCRDQKAKCSGQRPVCHRCQDAGVVCSYGDRKKENMAKQLNDLTSQVDTLESLLRDIYPRLDVLSSQLVDQTLKEIRSRTPLPQSNPAVPNLPTLLPSHTWQVNPSLSFTDASLGSPFGTAEYTDEDYNRDDKVQAMGFVGEHSEMAWLYRLKRDLDQDSFPPIEETPGRPAISSVNYFQDDSDLLLPDTIDFTHWPPQHLADNLVDAYFYAVHPAFPIFGKVTFLHQYRSFYSNPNLRPGKRWLALLNLVFAIATRYAVLTDQLQPDQDDHQTFFARAWSLSVGKVALLDHPDLQQVQVEGLAAFYLLSIGQVNRSWRIIGIAIRSAVTMGLNLRSESESVPQFSKEIRYRLWWALFMLDTVLCEMTGRPLSMREIFYTTPLPAPFQEEDFRDDRVVQLITRQEIRGAFVTSLLPNSTLTPLQDGVSRKHPPQLGFSQRKREIRTPQALVESQAPSLTPNTSLYFLYAVDLAHLLRETINILYAPRATRLSRREIETAISTFNDRADDWLSHLPAEFNFATPNTNVAQPFTQQSASLAFRFYATKLIITQPSLRLCQSSTEPRSPGATCDDMATICVQTACQMLDLLPESADTYWLYSIAPWWCVLHNIMQSTTILLVELFTRTHLGTAKATSLIQRVQKATRWLNEMSAKDPSSQRAWSVCTDILSRHGLKFWP
ncbi:hypothetical protein N7499_003746 [Penicillium canescens]|uniref:uncharacterized protein n=1 Tax=Penicillium canescens TaxID=5083 RepID=UPI0026E0F893|nr:uncharacterized protein N7446_014087 [Penicillium canescens]KAJ6018458.1 hypothetical protein N7522_001922 [Penicillium canescens]KAJ6039339.1 hypothetical protein N7446_014087 [Penicillium canescens]KAJ6066180.1 hypothetical protein N7444_000309 [Penicillium canescens]KAJ6091032.1 hypothetical protein N7499_003746 [Penicillium canescens]KAJ6175259.1 hypothetical protein N7485_005064 [Penicillium canescens]